MANTGDLSDPVLPGQLAGRKPLFLFCAPHAFLVFALPYLLLFRCSRQAVFYFLPYSPDRADEAPMGPMTRPAMRALIGPIKRGQEQYILLCKVRWGGQRGDSLPGAQGPQPEISRLDPFAWPNEFFAGCPPCGKPVLFCTGGYGRNSRAR